MVHPAMCTHPDPRRVLVIGGGDGGILREVLKYPRVERVDLAELDEEVIAFSRKYLSDINRGAFDDPRVAVHITDGRAFVQTHPASYDVIIMDMTDPAGPSRVLYTKEFFRLVKKAFRTPQGIFVMHGESPIARPQAFNCIATTLRSVFSSMQHCYTYIQMYAVLWSVALASSDPAIATASPALIEKRIRRHGLKDLKVFTGKSFAAMRVAYPYIDDILAQKSPVITDKKPDFPDGH